ncbi:hypothetical protein FALBO_3140 [Fusarium albosuccineum]|uniref:Uncharacterized protein n=1 Tax=Fusarium albosuccineum TaxID=1237068 RepID=A0A8H4PBY6_9HYPO|nr:hypothetical protein FALBO_3140 [Fusarium albosuccineum]
MHALPLALGAAMLASSASAFDLCRALHCIEPSDAPAVTINIEAMPEEPGRMVHNPILRIDLQESDQVCDPSRVRMLDQRLPIDENGRGSGTVYGLHGDRISAKWEFSCITPKDASTEHKFRFTIDSVEDAKIEEVSFETRFRQTWPIVFTSLKSSSFTEEPEYSRGTLYYRPDRPSEDSSAGEL